MKQSKLALTLDRVGVAYRIREGLFRSRLFWALQDVSFDVFYGETLGVIGRNGAGKSTLLRLLSGIIAPDKGKISTFDNRASLLTLQAGFIPHLTGRENAILSGMMLGMSREQIMEKMSEIAEFAELGDFIDQPAWTYSTGMRVRLGFAVAVQADPDIILIDEVLGVGDRVFRRKTAQLMQEKIQSDKTIVLVSHSLEMVRQLCDRVVWIERGKVRMEGDPKTVLSAYTRA
ncbi:MAG: ABC transporter ATP-binding protein [Zetaproteobacteria bacterium]|nr:MAG: ABC transporter ATP-binding protein [Zetaproteobacteria bacterium]